MRLSIILNMYNTAAFMPKCINSLLRQDIPAESYEIIMVNDGSPDHSLELAQQYVATSKACRAEGQSYPLMRVCSHANKGLAGARNTGIDAAQGEYLCFVDPDDYVEENSFAALLRQMDEEHLDVLRFGYQKVNEDYQPVADNEMEAGFNYASRIMTGNEFIAERLTASCYVWAYIYRSSFVKESGVRFVEGCFFDDTPWLPRLLQRASRVNCTSARHHYYLQRGGSMVHSANNVATMRKVNSQMQVIAMLLNQKQVAPASVRPWYNSMIAHLVVASLTSAVLVDYKSALTIYRQAVEMGVFPLSSYHAPSKTARKIHYLNACPRLFLLMLNLKNRK